MPTSPSIIPTDEPSVFDVVASLTTLERRALVRPDNPPAGIAGFLFDIPEEEEMNCRSAITDHYVEDNTAIQDQIALAPEEFTLRGLVAEVVAVVPTPEAQARVANPLPNNDAQAPAFTDYQNQQSEVTLVAINGKKLATASAGSLWEFYQNRAPRPPSQTRQSRAVLYFYEMWKGRQLFTIETPWGFVANVAILNFVPRQSEETKGQSSFTVTFKKIRTSGSASVAAGLLAGRAALQMAPVTNDGTAGQTPVSAADKQSLLYRLANGP